MKKILIPLAALLFALTASGANTTIVPLDPWTATTSPVASITQRVFGTPLKITGVATGNCLSLDGNSLLTTITCGSGGTGFGTTSANYWLTTKTTDDLTQGATNKYYSNSLVNTLLGTYDKGFFWSTTSAAYWNSTLPVPSSASSTLLSDNNTWTGRNIFGNATSSSFGITSLGTPAGTMLAVDPTGHIIATSTTAAGLITTDVMKSTFTVSVNGAQPAPYSLNIDGQINTRFILPDSGYLQNLHFFANGANTATHASSTIYINGLPTNLKLDATGVTAAANTTDIVFVNAGDTLSFLLEGSGTGVVTNQTSAVGYYTTLRAGYVVDAFGTTSANYWLTTKTTDNLTQGSTNKYYADSLVNTFLGTLDKGFFFSTTSSNYWFGGALAATTTDALAQGATNKYYSDTLVSNLILASTTIPKTNVANSFTATQNFMGATFNTATSGTFAIGSLSGILKGNDAISPISVAVAGVDYPGLNTINTFTQQQNFTDLTVSNIATTSHLCFVGGGCMSSPTLSGSNIILYPWNFVTDIPTYEGLRTLPDTLPQVDESCNAVTGATQGYCPAPIDNYVSTTTLSATGPLVLNKIPAGTWRFNVFTYVSSAAGISKIEINVLRRTAGGVETQMFQATSTEINDLTVALTTFESTQQAFAFDPTDRLVIRPIGWTDSGVARTVHWVYENGSHYSNVETPITIASEAVAFLPADNTFTGHNTFSGLTTLSNATTTLGTIGTLWSTLANITNGIFTSATTTNLGVNNETFTDLTGTGLQNIGGALTLNATGDWTGTFDGQEGVYYLNAKNLTNFGVPFFSFFNGTTTDALAQGTVNKYWSQTLFDNALTATTTLPNLKVLLGLTNATTTNLTVTSNAYFPSGIWNSSGNVGIGTTIPGVPFEIDKLGVGGTISELLRLRETTTGGGAGTGASIGFQVVGNSVNTGLLSSFYDGTNYPMAFKTYHGALTEDMRIVNGRVGIGTTSPFSNAFSTKLDLFATNFPGLSLSSGNVNGDVWTIGQDITGTVSMLKFFDEDEVKTVLTLEDNGRVVMTNSSTTVGTTDTFYTNSLRFSDGTSMTSAYVYKSVTWPPSAQGATTTTATTSIEIGPSYNGDTFYGAKCNSNVGTIVYDFSDGTNVMNASQATTTVSEKTFTVNNTFTAGEKRFFDIGPMTKDFISCTVKLIAN